MATNETILKRLQAGIEGSIGVAVAATRKVYARYTSSYERALAEFQDTTGTYVSRRRAMYGRQAVGFTVTDVGTYEDLPWWGKLGMNGAAAGVSDAGSPAAYAYDLTPVVTADNLKSVTLEHGEPGNPYESAQAMLQSFTVRGDGDSDDEPAWMFEGELVARDWAPTTFTPSLADRTTEPIIARGSKVSIDDAFDDLGDTQVEGKLISFSVTKNLNRHTKAFLEDEAGPAPGKVGRGAAMVDAQLVMEFDDDAEFAKYRADAPVKRFVRIEREGSVVHGSVRKRARIDMVGILTSFAEGDRDGNMIATFGMACFWDEEAGFDMRMEVVNALAVLA